MIGSIQGKGNMFVPSWSRVKRREFDGEGSTPVVVEKIVMSVHMVSAG